MVLTISLQLTNVGIVEVVGSKKAITVSDALFTHTVEKFSTLTVFSVSNLREPFLRTEQSYHGSQARFLPHLLVVHTTTYDWILLQIAEIII